MAGGTHAFDMIKRIKENENLKKLKYFKKNEKNKPVKSGQPIILDSSSWTNENSIKNKKDGFAFGRLVTRFFRIVIIMALIGVIYYLIMKILS